MPKDFEAQLKRVKSETRADRGPASHRDRSMTGGERAETDAEKSQRQARKRKRRQPPIIQRTP